MLYGDESINNPDNYEISRIPDTAELARLLLKAKGVSRKMAEFADECGTSASTFSRIANCKISQPIAKELIVKIAEHADPDSGVEVHHLLHANGMVARRENDFRKTGFYNENDPYSKINDLKNMLVSDLVERGNTIRPIKQIDEPEISRFARAMGRGNLLLQVSGCEAEYWKFRFMGLQGFSYARGIDGSDQNRRRNYKAEARMLLSRLAEVFLEDVWNPESLRLCKMSFVFSDSEYYGEFNNLIIDKKFNNWFSTILIDESRRHVVEEYVFERIDGKEMKSPLNYPLMSDSDSDWGTDNDDFYGYILGEDE